MRDELTQNLKLTETLSPLAEFFASENEVLRATALQAYAALETEMEAKRTLLRDALLDPDPDIRSDAMDALATIALPEDAAVVRRSLEGDPVREVKLAAVACLSRIGGSEDKDLLRALTQSRCDDHVAWEDALGDWEDWLDIQIAAIAALGALRDSDGIETILAARDDELAQTLDIQVFDALGQMGAQGASWLLAIIETEGPLARKRAVSALLKLAPEVLNDHAETLKNHADPALRCQAVTLMDPEDPALRNILMTDDDPTVRLAALEKGVNKHRDFAVVALRDTDARVQAAGLEALTLPLEPDVNEALKDNLIAWTEKAETPLMISAAKVLPRFAPQLAPDALINLATDAARPLTARIAAAQSLATCDPAPSLECWRTLLASSAQQIRLTALLALKDRASEDGVEDMLVSAMNGTLLSEADAVRVNADDEAASDMGVSKVDDAGPANIRITPEGDIVEVTENVSETSSTLASIMAPLPEPADTEMAEDTPEESAPKRRKRRAIEGPNEVAASLLRDAVRICGTLDSAAIFDALLEIATQDDDTPAVTAAWAALESHTAREDDHLRHAAYWAISHDDPNIRLSGFRVLGFEDGYADLKELARKDTDALIRAEAVSRSDAAAALVHITDSSNIVRKSAVTRLANEADTETLFEAFEQLVQAKVIDTLSSVLHLSDELRHFALMRLSSKELTPQTAYVILRALGQPADTTALPEMA